MLPLVLLLLAAPAVSPPAPVVPVEDARRWHRAVGLLQYLEGDYAAAVASGDKAELEEQRAFAREAVVVVESLGPRGAVFVPRARALAELVEAQSIPEPVVTSAGELAHALIAAGGLTRAPRRAPDPARGAAVYAKNCESCHGVRGDGDTAVGKALNPPAASFHDPARIGPLTPYKAFNTTTFGIQGTGMPPFPALTDDERWAVAFHLFTFRQPACEGKAPAASLEALATKTDGELASQFGEGAGACLRRELPAPDEGKSLARAHRGVEAALEAFKAHDATRARQELVDAYLEGVEPVEPLLRARSPERVKELETGFSEARTALQAGEGFEAAAGRLLAIIDRGGAEGTTRGTFWSVFLTALLILLREGFEAMVVVAALLAVLKKLGAREHARTVHGGWISALFAGAALYFFGQSLIAGARREVLETVVALAAVAMLLYAALWLNARANLSAHMGELRDKMQSALSRQSALGLFAISFFAVLRETAETALFLQGLATDSPQGAVWGALTGLLALAALVIFVSRAGFRLPMKALFNASTALLVATAVMLLGKGVHGLQELGVLGLSPIPFLDLPALGLFPDAWPTLAQAALLAAIGLYAWLRRSRPLPTVAPADG